MANVLVVYYSAYGHIHRLAEAVAEGAASVPGTVVRLRRVPEFEAAKAALSTQQAYLRAQEAQREIPEVTPDDLTWADGLAFGVPTRYGLMPAQMKQVFDSSGALWAQGALEGKAAGVFVSSGSIHGGQETTILTTMVALLHFGLILVGLPYGEATEQLTAEPVGGSPYGASTVAGPDGSRQPLPEDLTMARKLGARLARVAGALSGAGK